MSFMLLAFLAAALAQAQGGAPPAEEPVAQGLKQLPAPTRDPLRIDMANDPILSLARRSIDEGEFVELIRQAVARNPGVGEAEAGIAEAEAARAEAGAGLLHEVEFTPSQQRRRRTERGRGGEK